MRQRINIILFVLYVLIIADFIMSVVWGGFAKTASGLTIPDSTLIFPFIFFIIITAVQEAFYFTKKENFTFSLAIIILKAALVFVTLWVTNYYVFNVKYYFNSNLNNFYSNVYNTIIVAVCLGLVIVSTILESASAFCIVKKQKHEINY